MPKGGRRTGAGAKQKPAELKLLEGRFRKDRHAGAPAVVGAFPDPPTKMTRTEREVWKRFPKPGWIGQTDTAAVHAAISTYASILELQRARRKTPPGPEVLVDPRMTEECRQWGRLMSVLSTLGLTPADRAKMQAPKGHATAEDKWAGLL